MKRVDECAGDDGGVADDEGARGRRELQCVEPAADGAVQPGDAYTEGPYMVFTAQFHLRRGYCCNSGCRHCPYREGEASKS